MIKLACKFQISSCSADYAYYYRILDPIFIYNGLCPLKTHQSIAHLHCTGVLTVESMVHSICTHRALSPFTWRIFWRKQSTWCIHDARIWNITRYVLCALNILFYRQCRIIQPSWFTVANLTQIFQQETQDPESLQPLPFHYLEIGNFLLTHARDDLDRPERLRECLKDLEDVRQAKVRIPREISG